jgi:histidinol-phosphatase
MLKASPQRCNDLSTSKQYLETALRSADAADAVSLVGFTNRQFTVSRKNDNSEVTEIDRDTETAITSVLRVATPGFGIYGEEHGISGPTDAEYVWVIDPIDGTTNFVRGVPVWGTLIALVQNDVPIIGVVSAPALGMRWWASNGDGAYFNGTRIYVSTVSELSVAHVSTTPNKGWEKVGGLTALQQLQVDALRSRGFGDFWQHMLVAQGAIDIAIDAIGLAPYDNAAIYPIVQEAGGTITDRRGKPDWRANSMVSSNGLLHSTVINRLPS